MRGAVLVVGPTAPVAPGELAPELVVLQVSAGGPHGGEFGFEVPEVAALGEFAHEVLGNLASQAILRVLNAPTDFTYFNV